MPNASNHLVLPIDDDSWVRSAVATALERDGLTGIACVDVESGQVLIERYAEVN
jgi:DNA-binding NtrC family response regulator